MALDRRAIFLCRSGNTRPSVSVNAARHFVGEWRMRLPPAPPTVGQQSTGGAASRHPCLTYVHTRYRPKVKHLLRPSDTFFGVPKVIGYHYLALWARLFQRIEP